MLYLYPSATMKSIFNHEEEMQRKKRSGSYVGFPQSLRQGSLHEEFIGEHTGWPPGRRVGKQDSGRGKGAEMQPQDRTQLMPWS